jgi:60 kDa SS-A/Ro ribonucleoprotein
MDAYASFNTRTTAQSKQSDSRQVRNNAGGFVFTIDPLAQVRRFLILGSDAGTYYQTANDLTAENARAVIALAESDGVALVDLIVDVSVGGKAPRQNPALFALAIAASFGSDEAKSYALSKLQDVARTGTHLFIFARYVEQFRGWGRGLRKAVGNWYVTKPVDDVAYQAVKYRQREGWSHRDLLRLAHPKTTEDTRRALFDWISNRPVEGVPRIVEGFTKAQEGGDPAALVREYGLSWEMLPDEALSRTDVWDALIDNGLPHGALIRQLPRLTNLGIIAPFGGRTAEIAAQLTDPAKLRKARIHPVNILVAAKTYAKGQGRGSSWSPVTGIVNALDEAFYNAFDTVEAANKRTMIGLDVSGSMGGATDPSGLLTAREVGAAFSLVIASTEPGSEVFGFTGNRSGWTYGGETSFTPLNISRKQRLDDVMRNTSNLPFGNTDCALPMVEALKNGWQVDTFVIITDNETWVGNIHPHQALRKYREATGIDSKLVVMTVTATSFSIADPTDPGMLDVVGFSSDVPNLVTDFSRGF